MMTLSLKIASQGNMQNNVATMGNTDFRFRFNEPVFDSYMTYDCVTRHIKALIKILIRLNIYAWKPDPETGYR